MISRRERAQKLRSISRLRTRRCWRVSWARGCNWTIVFLRNGSVSTSSWTSFVSRVPQFNSYCLNKACFCLFYFCYSISFGASLLPDCKKKRMIIPHSLSPYLQKRPMWKFLNYQWGYHAKIVMAGHSQWNNFHYKIFSCWVKLFSSSSLIFYID